MCGMLQKNTLSTGTKRRPNRKKKKKHCTGMEMDSFQGSELPDSTGLHGKVKMG